MDKEEKIKKRKIIRNHRDDDLLNKVIDEFCVRFHGQITREEVEKILKDNGFDGIYVLSDEDYFRVNEDEGKEIATAGTYIPALKCITLREKFLSKNIAIGCHELTHALIDGKLSYIAKCSEWEVSYGIGLEEGVATAIERMEGNVNICNDNTYRFGYGKNYLVIRELDLLYKKSQYKKYDSIIMEAIKHPNMFFNLIYRMILDNIKGIYGKAKDKDISIEEIKMIALKCSFVILQSTDMLVEFNNSNAPETNKQIVLTAYGYTRFLNGCLLSYLDKNIRNGIISPEYIGPFYKKDLSLLQLTDADRLLMAIFDEEITYHQRLAAYINKILVEYILEVEKLEKETDSNLVYKKQL